MQIAVIGSSDATEKQKKIAYEVGKIVAESGATLISGGRGGVMEESCRGCKENGGKTIGVLPKIDGSDANPFLDIQIRTGLGYARNSIVVNSADAVIVVGGSHGTLSEMCFASFGKKPIICIEGSGGWAEKIIGKSLDLNEEHRTIGVSLEKLPGLLKSIGFSIGKVR